VAAAALAGFAVCLSVRSAPSPASADADEAARRCGLLAGRGVQDSLTCLALCRGQSVIFSGSGKAAVAYRVVHGVSLAAGDPVGDPEAWPGAITQWLEEAGRRGWRPAVLGASERGAVTYRRAGLAALEMGDEAIIDAAAFTLEDRAMTWLRREHARLAAGGYTVTAPSLEGVPRGAGCVAGCTDRSGTLRAFVSFAPWGAGGLSVDVTGRDRRRDDGLPVYIVTEVLRRGPALGVSRLSLNVVWFRRVFERGRRIGAGPFLRAELRVLLLFERWWHLESRYRAVSGYQPAWSPRFLCFAAARDLPVIAMAAARVRGNPAWPRGGALKPHR
jgi:lysyl-tRNA synthetase, class II